MKIGTSMGLMVLVAALLMGTGMAANTAGCTASGCLLTTDYYELDASGLTTPVSFGLLPAVDFADPDTPDLKVLAEKDWAITVKDNNDMGKMRLGTTSTYLTAPLQVNNVPLGTTTGVEVASGTATSDCVYDEVDLEYDQSTTGDTTVGLYSISITYTLGADN